jgi:ethanolamine-phosphate cytidylyltransferase|tara:strand:- start:5 stop:1285 length:1281 start_codon:yes stop_codon:yes gene_type:complete
MIPFVSSSFLLVGAVALLRAKKTLKKTRKVFRVYVDGCFDLMHFGHANALRQARAIASFASTGGKEGGYVEGAEEVELIVGLVSDEEILRCKGPPVLPEQERVKCVRAVKWVDDIIANVPYELTREFVEELFSEKYGIDCIVHGDDPCYLPDGTDAYAIPKALGKYREIKRTEGVSTTDLVARLLEYADASENTTSQVGDESSGGKRSEKNERHEARFCTTASRIAQFAAKVSYSKTSKMHEETEKRKTDKKQRKNEKNEETTCCYVVGAFDVFNAGHVELLEECSFVADKVVCAVIADEYLTRDQTNQPPPMLNQSERAMSAIACRHCDDVVVGAPARLTDDICKTFNVTAVVFEDDDAVTERDRNVCEKNGVQILSVKERVFSRKKLTIAKRVQANRALFEERQKRKMASEKAYYEQKAFVAED